MGKERRSLLTLADLEIMKALCAAADAGDITQGDLSFTEDECKAFDALHAKVNGLLAAKRKGE